MKEIAAAFVKAKRAFAPALKTSLNPHFKSRYADLAACVEAVDGAFLENGIVMYQETQEDQTGVMVQTVLMHESGEAIRCGWLHVPAVKQDAQAYGSALSYARRYSLMAACGIAPEDDDGAAASRPRQAEQRQPDVTAILRGISNATTLELLKSNFESAMQMLEPASHPAVIKAKNTRYKELHPQKETA